MKKISLGLVAAAALSTVLFAGGDIDPVEPIVEAPVASESGLELSANVALTSNYVWRGMTQTDNSPAIQGGFDLGYKGLYVGVWGSNVEFGSTYDERFGIGYDVGVIEYAYPHNTDALNFAEAYVGLSKAFGDFEMGAKYYVAIDVPSGADKLDYWQVDTSYALPMDFGISASYGDYEDTGSNYIVSLSKAFDKFEVSIAYTDFNADSGSADDQDHIVGTISASF
ncbi:MAG: TorF family putative porin [Sulfurovaceae bacterium]